MLFQEEMFHGEIGTMEGSYASHSYEPMDTKVEEHSDSGYSGSCSTDTKVEDLQSESSYLGSVKSEDVKSHSNYAGETKTEIPDFDIEDKIEDVFERATINPGGHCAAAGKWPKNEVCDQLSYDEFKWMYKNLQHGDINQKWRILNEKFRISAKEGRHQIKEEANYAITELKQRLVGTSAYETKLRELRSFSVSVSLPNGSIVDVTIRPFERVLSLKERIQSTTGYSIEKQRLFERSNELQDDETLEQRLVVSGALFTMLLQEEGFEIFVQGIATKLYLLRDLKAETKVSELRQKISEREKIEPSKQVLKFGCHNLENSQTLGSYGIRQGSTVTVTGRLRGGLL